MAGMRRAVLVVLALVACVVGSALPAVHATQAGERVAAYTVHLTLERSGRLHVVETIDYDFGPNERHGIYRTIPVRFHHDDRYDRVYPVDNLEVTGSPGTPTDVDVTDEGGSKRIRIGDPDRTISGRHSYRIAYDVDGSVNRFAGHDELYWNAIGTEWEVPIDDARVLFRGPAGVSRIACFAGPEGSSLPCGEAASSDERAELRHGSLPPYSGLALVVAIPRGAVDRPGPVLAERFSLDRAFARSPIAIALALIVLVAGLLVVARLAWRTGRDRRFVGEVPGLVPPSGVTGTEESRPLFADPAGAVQFTPPDDMRPAIMGVLIDERADPLDVTATIVDLAVRRHLRIDEIPKKWFFSAPDWTLTRLEPPADTLTTWEQTLLDALFASGPTVELSDLKNEFYTHLRVIQTQLYDDVMARRWFTKHPDKQRGTWFAIGATTVVVGGLVTQQLAQRTHLALAGLPIVLCGLVLLAVHRRMPARTGRGSAALAQALGFRRYLHTAEQAQLQFEEDAGVFARYLPYAVVLGETKRWARAFEKLGTAPPADAMYWYGGSGDWSPSRFADSVSSFSVMTAGTVASTPSSSGSSGFSGGSSGGGGGGGGGGSW
ncbi:MAG TPA: DUF2207 domain-containing protein [Mycobacteriales bacterium]|nr:DUF2207 domain-containing protein [Mycobacteriales bacterium]